MPEERDLWANIRFKIDQDSLRDISDSIGAAFHQGLVAGIPNQQGPNTGGSSGGNQSVPAQQQGGSAGGNGGSGGSGSGSGGGNGAADAAGGDSTTVADGFSQWTQMVKDKKVGAAALQGLAVLTRDTSGMQEGDAKEQAQEFKALSGAIKTGLGQTVNLFKQTFGLIEDIDNRMKQASPLLQAISNLFDLAMTLFFLPLGNKLAEVMLPAVLELVDAVVDLWDKFEGKSLSEIFEIAFTDGVNLFAKYFTEIGSLLADQGGFLDSIGKLLQTIGSFLQKNLESLLSTVLSLASFLLDHIKEIISIMAAFFAAKLAMDVLTMYVIATGNTIGGWAGAGIVTATAGLAGLGTYGYLNSNSFAEGGHVDATPGGRLIRVAEGGEGESIVPDSKRGSFGSNTYNYYINGYTDSDLQDKIEQTVNRQISQSRIRAGI